MLDATQFSSWVVVALFLVAAGFLASYTGDRSEVVAGWWERITAWLEAHGHGEADEDEAHARLELVRVLREERLLTDLERVRHLVATDTYMSATRQLGNRMAYEQLLAETRDFAAQPAPLPPYRAWAIERVELATTRRQPEIETLDLRWR